MTTPSVPPPGCPAHGSGQRIPLDSAEFAANPHAYYRYMREFGPTVPVTVAPGVEATLVTDYNAALELLQDSTTFRKDSRRWRALAEGCIRPDSPVLPLLAYRPNAMFTDGAEHVRLRQAITDSFARVSNKRLSRIVSQAAQFLINQFSARGSADLLRDYAQQLPLYVFNELFGCPAEIGDRVLFGISGMFDGVNAEAASQVLLGAVGELVALKRAQPALGALLSTIGMTGLVYAIISGPGHGWLSGQVLASAAVGAVFLAAFVRWELSIEHPMLDMHFFRDRRFVGAVAGSILVAFGMGGSLFLLTQHLQFVLGYGPLEAGLRTAPLALSVVILNMTGVGAKLVATVGTPRAIAIGMTANAAGLASIALLGGHNYGGTLFGLVVMGAGIALSMPAMANAIMSAIPPEKAGVGAGVNGTLGEFGNGLGVAVLGAVLNSRFAALAPVAAASLPAALAAAGDGAERGRIADAFASGLETSQLVGAGAVLAGGLLAAVLLHRAERSAPAPDGAAPAA
ncbi:MFS transporter [Streptomyces sp. NPDC048491]|uniref:MFS transporter n=1 Tax=Streptomyces sp. NPDC048491 TaxID=3157207 RepID=UPI003444581A